MFSSRCDRRETKHACEKECIHDFVWKIERERPLGRSRRKWEEKIKIDLSEIVDEVANRIELASAQSSAGFNENCDEPPHSIQTLSFLNIYLSVFQVAALSTKILYAFLVSSSKLQDQLSSQHWVTCLNHRFSRYVAS